MKRAGRDTHRQRGHGYRGVLLLLAFAIIFYLPQAIRAEGMTVSEAEKKITGMVVNKNSSHVDLAGKEVVMPIGWHMELSGAMKQKNYDIYPVYAYVNSMRNFTVQSSDPSVVSVGDINFGKWRDSDKKWGGGDTLLAKKAGTAVITVKYEIPGSIFSTYEDKDFIKKCKKTFTVKTAPANKNEKAALKKIVKQVSAYCEWDDASWCQWKVIGGQCRLTEMRMNYVDSEVSFQGFPELRKLNLAFRSGVSDRIEGWSRFTSLDVSGNPKLEYLNCETREGSLEKLKLGEAKNLKVLECGKTKLSSLNLEGAQELRKLSIASDRLGSLDFSGNPKLEELEVEEQTGTESKRLSKLNISKNKNLTSLMAKGIQPGVLDISHNTNLEVLSVSNCGLPESLDTSIHKNLKSLELVGVDELKYLNLNENTALEELVLGGCKNIGEMDLSKNTQLRCLEVRGCQNIKRLDVGRNKKLTKAQCECELAGV